MSTSDRFRVRLQQLPKLAIAMAEPLGHLKGWPQAKKDATFTSGLLDMPAEIRLMIYELCIGEPIVAVYDFTVGWLRQGNAKTTWFQQPCMDISAGWPIRILLLCRQINAEARSVLWDAASFELTVDCHQHAWFDAAKPVLRTTMPMRSIQKLDLEIPIELGDNFVWSPRFWLKARMKSRKNCLFFSEMGSLRYLKIAIVHHLTTRIDSGPHRIFDAFEGDSETVAWLIHGIPRDVELQWVSPNETKLALQGRMVDYLSSERLRTLEIEHRSLRGTALTISKDRREKPPGKPEPAFMVAWSARQRQAREKRKAAQVSTVEVQEG